MFSMINIGLVQFFHLEELLFTAPLTSEVYDKIAKGTPKCIWEVCPFKEGRQLKMAGLG